MAATDWVRPEIAELSAYHVAPARDMRKLDAMENPYELPAALRDELAQELAQAALNRYPDPSGGGLKEELAAAFGVPAGMPLFQRASVFNPNKVTATHAGPISKNWIS